SLSDQWRTGRARCVSGRCGMVVCGPCTTRAYVDSRLPRIPVLWNTPVNVTFVQHIFGKESKGVTMNAPLAITLPYQHTPLFPLGEETTSYRKLSSEGVRIERVTGRDVLAVEREALRMLSEAAFTDINHLLRPGHLAQLRSILEDPEASENDRFVAYDFLKK